MKTTTRRTRTDTNKTPCLLKASNAANLLAQAARFLEAAAAETTWQCGRADFLHYAEVIRELLSSDDAEAGLNPTIDLLFARKQTQGMEAHGRVHTIAKSMPPRTGR